MKNRTESDFILDFQKSDYPYLEEINEGILKQIAVRGENACILDVGAGRGALGEALRALSYQVYAIETDAMAARQASQRVDHVICADLHDMDTIKKQLKNKKFKYIIFADVLEHVFDPLTVLRNYLPLLALDGKLIISLPNAVNWLNRLYVMLGMFNYKMTGVKDRTHIRFFTFRSAKKMLEASQCIVERVDSTPFIIRAFLPIIKMLCCKTNHLQENGNPKTILESSYYQLYKNYFYPIEYWVARVMPSLLAFQIILVARHKLK